MEHHPILDELAAYCEAVGLKPSTVCVRATGSGRVVDRLKRRLAQTEKDASRIRAYIKAHPPAKTDAA